MGRPYSPEGKGDSTWEDASLDANTRSSAIKHISSDPSGSVGQLFHFSILSVSTSVFDEGPSQIMQFVLSCLPVDCIQPRHSEPDVELRAKVSNRPFPQFPHFLEGTCSLLCRGLDIQWALMISGHVTACFLWGGGGNEFHCPSQPIIPSFRFLFLQKKNHECSMRHPILAHSTIKRLS